MTKAFMRCALAAAAATLAAPLIANDTKDGAARTTQATQSAPARSGPPVDTPAYITGGNAAGTSETRNSSGLLGGKERAGVPSVGAQTGTLERSGEPSKTTGTTSGVRNPVGARQTPQQIDAQGGGKVRPTTPARGPNGAVTGGPAGADVDIGR